MAASPASWPSATGKRVALPASEVIVCAGAVHSAALLLRSGIGPADELKALGIAPVADRPGVGRNYQNHSLLHFALTLKPQSRLGPEDRHYTMTSLRFSSGLEGCPAGDLFLYFVGRVSGRTFGTRMGMVAAALYAPFSRGSVTLQSRDAHVPPVVAQRLLTDPRDARRMVMATRLAEALIVDPSVRDCFDEAYLLPRDPPLRLVNGIGAAGRPEGACGFDRARGSRAAAARGDRRRDPARPAGRRPERRQTIGRCGNPCRLRHDVSSELHLRDRTRRRQDGGGRSGMPRLRRARDCAWPMRP